jgi:hypothetical protein
MRTFVPAFLIAFGLIACGDDKDSGDSGAAEQSAACQLAEEHAACPECDDGEVTCSYGDESATENSCGGCQAEAALYRQLCDAGVEDSLADIEAGLSCSDPVTE